jgi:Zn-dependent protease
MLWQECVWAQFQRSRYFVTTDFEQSGTVGDVYQGRSMRGSYRLGQAFGIGVFVHWSFALLLGYVVLSTLDSGAGWVVALNSAIFVLAVFGCVLLHEFGHSLAARRYGIGTHDITLLPIGGVARLESIPEDPKQELVIAVAGPAVNVVIAAVLVLLAVVFKVPVPVTGMAMVSDAALLHGLISANIILVVFNMIPAFPMDGGRVFRAFVAMRKGTLPATEIAAKLGKVMAVLMCVGAIYLKAPFLFLTAAFVFLAGHGELQAVRARHQRRGEPMRAMMNRAMAAFSVGEGVTPEAGDEMRKARGRVVE